MTTPFRFEQDLPRLIEDAYLAGTPDYRDDLVRRIAATPQRPAWAFPERWLPVDITTQAAAPARMPWRQLGILALIGILIAVAAAAYVGSQQRDAAPPFGLAANGDIVLLVDGDIVVADPTSGASTVIVTGPETDEGPVYSPDGTRIGFLRAADGVAGTQHIMVVSPDGSGLAQVTPEPLDELLTWTFSPDGRDVLAVTQGEGRPAILILPVDGASPPRVLDVVALADEPVDYRPPDGHELLVVTKPDVGKGRAIEAVDLESGAARTIVAASLIDVFGAGWSPTGDYVTYQAYEAGGVRGHIVGADGQGDRLVDPASTAGSDFAEIWSNDGTLLALRSRAMDGAPDLWSIVSVDGSRPRVEVRCDPAAGVACPDGLNWSPDDSTLIGCICVEDESARYVLVDPATGRMTELALPGDGGYDWQRRAP